MFYSEGQRLNAGFSVWRKQGQSSTKSSSGGVATHPAPGAKHKSGITCMRHLRRQKLPIAKKIRRKDSATKTKILEKPELTTENHILAETTASLTWATPATVTAEQAPPKTWCGNSNVRNRQNRLFLGKRNCTKAIVNAVSKTAYHQVTSKRWCRYHSKLTRVQ